MLKFSDKIILFPLWLISLIPLKILFLGSWVIYFFVYHLLGYRRKVVYENLRRSFPDKSDGEIRSIARRFYLHLCDSIFETIKMAHLTPDDISKRYKLVNPELVEDLYKNGKDLAILGAHYANWEWASCTAHLFMYKLIGIYKPLTNKMFDRYFVHLRGRLGGFPVPMSGTLRAIMDSKKKNRRFMVYLVSDQRPQWSDLKHWIPFLNQDTPVITGTEKLAKRFDLVPVFMDTKQVKRGYYEITFRVISENPKESKEFEITNKYIKLVENQVIRDPEFYLWSHKRWKYNRQNVPGVK